MTRRALQPSLRKRVLLSVLGLALGLGSVEVLARWTYREPGRQQFIPDPILGVRHAPSSRVWMTNEAREFNGWFSTNAHGDPDRERAITAPGNVYRVAVIGDSMVEAAQVRPEQRFTSILERQLNERAGEAEVLNFGTSSYGPAQEWLYYRTHVRQYSPDLVVLVLLPGNDIRNSSYNLEVVRCNRPYLRPFFEFSTESGLRLRDAVFYENACAEFEHANRKRSSENWVRKLALVRIARNLRRQVAAASGDGESVPAVSPEVQVTLELFDPSVQRESADWQQAWRLTGAIIEQFAAEVTADGSRFFVLVATGPWEIYDSARRRALELAGLQPEDDARFDWRLPHDMTNRMLTARGISFANVFPAVEARARQSEQPLHFLVDGHYTPAGHQLVAAELLPVIEQDLSSHYPSERSSSSARLIP